MSWPDKPFATRVREPGGARCLAEEQRRAWLRTTVANIAVSGSRREAAWWDRLPRIEARYRKAPVDITALAFSSIVLEPCWQIIQDMPERQHAVASLRGQQGMKQATRSAALGMTEKTASAHLSQACPRPIARLGRDWYQDQLPPALYQQEEILQAYR